MASIPEMFERKWPQVILLGITVANGIVTVSSTKGLHTKMEIILKAIGQPDVLLQIKRIISDTEIIVGKRDTEIAAYENPVLYNGGTLIADEQDRNKFNPDYVLRAVYEEEPAVALRTYQVDRFGQGIDSIRDAQGVNRIAVDANISIDSAIVTVDLDGVYSPTNLKPDSVGIILNVRDTTVGIDDQTFRPTGIVNGQVHAQDVAVFNSDGSPIGAANPLYVTFNNTSDFGASAQALRVAALLGNQTGQADFNVGPTTAQTLRTSSNLTDEAGNQFTDANYLPVGQSVHDNLNANANVQQNNVDVSALNPLFTQTTNGTLETTQQQVLSELQTIDNSLDAIEVDADLIKIATQSIDSNVDVTLSTRASELTQLELLNSQAIDKVYTRLEVATKNDDGNPTSILVKNGLTTVRTLTLTYDADGDFLSLEKS